MKAFVESLDGAFENVCELDLVFHFDEVRRNVSSGYLSLIFTIRDSPKAHDILAEISQGGLVLETNVNEIDRAGESRVPPTLPRELHSRCVHVVVCRTKIK